MKLKTNNRIFVVTLFTVLLWAAILLSGCDRLWDNPFDEKGTMRSVVLSTNISTGGSVKGAGTFVRGNSQTVTATPATGYTFTNWTENGAPVSTSVSYSFSLSKNRTLVANFTLSKFTITTSANPTSGGTVTGGGTYDYNTSRTIVATPGSGFTFTNWTEGGTPVSTSASYTFTVSGTRTFVANFSIVPNFTILLSSNPATGGSTTGAGTYVSGTNQIVTATPATGYSFTNWTENGAQVSANASYIFSLAANRTLVANFAPINYTVSTSSNPGAGGNTTGGGTYAFGTGRTFTATASSGYSFVNWTEGGTPVSTSASYTFTVSGNRTLVANFSTATNYTIALSSNPGTAGSTTGAGTFVSGTSQTITATPATGYTFTNWTEGTTPVSTTASYTFTLFGNRTLVANFTPINYNVSTSSNPVAGGNTTGGGTYAFGTSRTLTATPNSGYSFVNWTEGGTPVSTSANYTFTVSGNRTLVANFSVVPNNTIALSSNPATAGSTTGAGTFVSGTSQTVTATPATGYTFTNWTEGATPVSTTASYTFTLSGNRTLVANFTTINYTVSTSSNPIAGGNTSGNLGTYPSGASLTVIASPAKGYTFTNWTENSAMVSTNASYTFSISANRTLVANFTPINYTISTSSNPVAGGNTTGGGAYAFGTSRTVTATPASGYVFSNWTENGNPVSSSASYILTVSGNRTLVANFSVAQNFGIEMVTVQGGTFQMSNTTQSPIHSVTLSTFQIGKYEVTQALWLAVMGNRPSYFTGNDQLPVEQVNWEIIQTFILKLNQLSGLNYRLPTEAEWEFAARGGIISKGYKYSGSDILTDVGWWPQNSSTPRAIGLKKPNELGIYDMSGNVNEWCFDWYGSYSSASQSNPTGPTSGTFRIQRGGSWFNESDVFLRRGVWPTMGENFVGFRLARSL